MAEASVDVRSMNFCLPVAPQTQERFVFSDRRSISPSPPSDAHPSSSSPSFDVDNNSSGNNNKRTMTEAKTLISRIPCKARGILDTHTARNAYIEIPENAVHGMMLLCSHPVCAKTRRFRFCTVCGLPVAKRNFLKRHGHGLIRPRQRVQVVPLTKTAPPSVDPSKGPETEVVTDRDNNNSPSPGSESGDHLTNEETRWLELYRCRPINPSPEILDQWVQKIVSAANQSCQSQSCESTSCQSLGGDSSDGLADDESVANFMTEWFDDI